MRQTEIMIRCDNPDCEVAVAIPSEDDTPAGWYIVIPVREPGNPEPGGKAATVQRSLRGGFTLCCAECVGAWGLYREEALSVLSNSA